MDRYYWARRIQALDPYTEHFEISRILSWYEFPWDIVQALSFALYRTYAVPSIGRLLHRTGEFTDRAQKRYDDTALILDAILEHGPRQHEGRDALRRMNRMHGSYDISNDDMRYVLSTFVVQPMRWLDAYGWRALTEHERIAACSYYRELGRNMGIRDIPATHQEFAALLDDYERTHFAFDPAARAVADSTLELMTTFPPNNFAPKPMVRRFAFGLMDDHLLDAFDYPRPSTVQRRISRGALRLRGRLVRHLPPRRGPKTPAMMSSVRSYPDGYATAELGTFPRDPAPARFRR